MHTYYSNEIVFRGHPDKVCDQISAAILQNCLRQDENTRAGIEVAGGKGVIFITGEVKRHIFYSRHGNEAGSGFLYLARGFRRI